LKKDMPSSKGCRLYVGNINHKVRPREVEKLFSDYGEVVDFDFKDRGQQVNFCFVEYRRSSDAELAIEKLGGRRLLGAPLIVEHARDRNEKKRGSRFDSFGPSSHVKRRFDGSSLSRSHSRGRGHGRGHSRSRSRSPSHSHGRRHSERRSHNEKVSGTHNKDRSSRSRSNNTRSRSRKRKHSSRHDKSGRSKGSRSNSHSRSRSNASKQPQPPPQQQNGTDKVNTGNDKKVDETFSKEKDGIPTLDSNPSNNPPNGNADDAAGRSLSEERAVDKGNRPTNANWNEKESSKSPPTTRLASDLDDATKETHS